MPRPLVSLLLAAAVAAAAGFGAAGVDPLSAVADDVAHAPAAAALPPGAPTAGLVPRIVVPQRDRALGTAGAHDPLPPADPGAADGPRRLHDTGELLAADGTSQDPVDRGGGTVRFSVEVEAATGLDPEAVASLVEEALYDQRSWARTHDLRRVAPADASIHVVVASPATVDALCRRAGLDTAGWLSCWNGDTAAINVERWMQGVAHHGDLAQYRRYVVNHEVGHGLGQGHRSCPGSGRLAPLMQQQTKSLDGCAANEWKFPDA